MNHVTSSMARGVVVSTPNQHPPHPTSPQARPTLPSILKKGLK